MAALRGPAAALRFGRDGRDRPVLPPARCLAASLAWCVTLEDSQVIRALAGDQVAQ